MEQETLNPKEMNSPNDADKKVFLIKTKVEDMIKYGKPIVDKFPGRERELASEIRQSMMTLYRLIVKVEKKYYKKTTLQEFDEELEVLRHLIRMAADKDYYDQQVVKKDKNGNKMIGEDGKPVYVSVSPPLSTDKKYTWSEKLNEIGRMLGGYIESIKGSPKK